MSDLLYMRLIILCIVGTLASSFFSSLDDKHVLKWAELCQKVYGLHGTNDEMTSQLLDAEIICPGDKVVLQAYRNLNQQLSSVVIKTHKQNHFKILFVGTAGFMDGLVDISAIPVREHVHKCLKEATPNHLVVRHKKQHRLLTQSNEAHHHLQVDVHAGFKAAGKQMMEQLFEKLRPYIDTEKDLHFNLTGHSLGGALASHMAYHIMKRLAKAYAMPQQQVHIKLITFGAAGCFLEEDLAKVAKVTAADETTVHFYRHHDLARELTELVGFMNPGLRVFIADFVSSDGTLAEYIHNMAHFQESPHDIANRIHEELANHSIANYIKTILDAMKDKEPITGGDTHAVVSNTTQLYPITFVENLLQWIWHNLYTMIFGDNP